MKKVYNIDIQRNTHTLAHNQHMQYMNTLAKARKFKNEIKSYAKV